MAGVGMLVAAGAMAAICAGAHGAIVTVEFAGTMGIVIVAPYPGAAVGNTFQGSFSYDTSTPSTADDGTVANYGNSLRSFGLTVQTAGGPATLNANVFSGTFGGLGNPSAGLMVKNDEPDIFMAGRIIDAFNTTAGNSTSHMSMGLALTGNAILPATGPLTGRQLPETLDLASFNVNTNQQVQIVLSFSALCNGSLTSLRVVPAPGAGAVLGLGALMVGRRRR